MRASILAAVALILLAVPICHAQEGAIVAWGRNIEGQFYEDGQVWINVPGQQIFERERPWERPVQPTPSERGTWGTVKGAFR